MSFPNNYRTSEEWIEEYKRRNALWIHDGNPKRPHVILRGGEHSAGFFNSELVLQDPILLDHACHNLVAAFTRNDLDLRSIKRVVGPAMGAITVAHDIARHVALRTGNMCLRGYVQKSKGTDGKPFMFFERTEIEDGERILLVEDVITSGSSVALAALAVERIGGVVLPFLVSIVNRSGLEKVNGHKIIALITDPMPKWAAHDCPLCEQGSEALSNPKTLENWARLNAVYV